MNPFKLNPKPIDKVLMDWKAVYPAPCDKHSSATSLWTESVISLFVKW